MPEFYAWNHDLPEALLTQVQTIENFHLWLINEAQSLGFPVKSDGCCKGFANTASLALWVTVLSGDNGVETYLQRLIDIKYKADRQPKIQKHRLFGFFDSILLYQKSQFSKSLVKDVFGKIMQEEVDDLLDKLLCPVALSDAERRKVISSIVGAYTIDELQVYLQIFSRHLGDLPFELSLDSGNHTLSLFFCPTTKDWILIDANNIPLQAFDQEHLGELTEKLFAALFGLTGKYVLIETTIKTTALCEVALIDDFRNKLEQDAVWCVMHDLGLKEKLAQNKVFATNLYDYSLLFLAARCGCADLVEVLLQLGADVDSMTNDNGATPLFIAAQKGHVKSVKILLDWHAKLDQPTIHGGTPLFTAAQNGFSDIVSLLIKYGDSVNQAIGNGATPLYVASQNGCIDVLKILLKANVEINRATNDGVSPLFIAAQNGHYKAVELLLKWGGDAAVQEMRYGATPLDVATQNGHVNIARLLRKSMQQNVGDARKHACLVQ